MHTVPQDYSIGSLWGALQKLYVLATLAAGLILQHCVMKTNHTSLFSNHGIGLY